MATSAPLNKMLVIMAEKFLAVFTHHVLAVGDKLRQDLLVARVVKPQRFSSVPPGLEIGELPNEIDAQVSYGLSVKISNAPL